MAVVDIDDDTAQAVINLWQKTAALTTLFKEPPRTGKLKKQPNESPSKRMPYAGIEVKKGKENQRMTGGIFHDFREVTITAIGVKADASKALALIKTTFGLNIGTFKQPTLDLPSGDRFIQAFPINDGELTEDATTKEAQDVWRAVVRLMVWSIRQDV